MKRVAVLISGGGSNMLALLSDMVGDHPGRAVFVGSNDPSALGLVRAAEMGVAVAAVDHRAYGRDRAAFEAALLEPILAAEPDILCLAGFMRVLTPAFVRRFEGRMLNIHPSLLPKYPGLHTHARALAAGDQQAGCTVHEVTAELDAGPILGQARVAVLPGDNEADLSARVLVQEHRLYPAVLRRFAAGDRSLLTL
ncbi:MAG: phosphoribosylglycinamide formyltransferase [Pseudomonadota bacterium]